jgi:hypothetical protein
MTGQVVATLEQAFLVVGCSTSQVQLGAKIWFKYKVNRETCLRDMLNNAEDHLCASSMQFWPVT